MTALAAAALATVVNAATVNWQSGTIFIASDAVGTTGSGTSYRANAGTRLVTAYLYSLTADEYTAALAMSTADLYSTYSTKAATLSQNSTAMGIANIAQTGMPDGSTDAPQTAYGLVLYVDTTTAAAYDGVDAFVKSYVGTATWKNTTGAGLTNLAATQSTWTAVPEPTSGLLMLLGMAGLALRRKRA
ncbi:MAG: PEP-CTERM sorting domain-containing protein [Kiritimatiellae bacterium]|nr:PEP-CTERM sorting domain-containing protein [Kiritimatiellia bacterium]